MFAILFSLFILRIFVGVPESKGEIPETILYITRLHWECSRLMGDRKLEPCETQRGKNYTEGREAISKFFLFFNRSSSPLCVETRNNAGMLCLYYLIARKLVMEPDSFHIGYLIRSVISDVHLVLVTKGTIQKLEKQSVSRAFTVMSQFSNWTVSQSFLVVLDTI